MACSKDYEFFSDASEIISTDRPHLDDLPLLGIGLTRTMSKFGQAGATLREPAICRTSSKPRIVADDNAEYDNGEELEAEIHSGHADTYPEDPDHCYDAHSPIRHGQAADDSYGDDGGPLTTQTLLHTYILQHVL